MAERIHQIHFSDDALQMCALCILVGTAGAAGADDAAAIALNKLEGMLNDDPARYARVQDELFKQVDVRRLQ